MKEITQRGAKFVDGTQEQFDSVVLATGYRSNVPSWLKVHLASPFSYLNFWFTSCFVGTSAWCKLDHSFPFIALGELQMINSGECALPVHGASSAGHLPELGRE